MLISIHCCTFRRPHLVEEVLGCFLQQDFCDSELVIINDEPQQELIFDHPRVKIFNLKNRERTLHSKRCIAVSECSGEYLMCLDDDDLISPDRVSRAINGLNRGVWASDRYYIDSDPPKTIIGTMHWNFVCSKKIYTRVGGYNLHPAFGNSGVRLKMRLERYMQENGIEFDTSPPTILYRRYTTSVSHTEIEKYVQFEKQEFQRGKIILSPKYKSRLFNEVARAATLTQTKEECQHTNQKSLRRVQLDCI